MVTDFRPSVKFLFEAQRASPQLVPRLLNIVTEYARYRYIFKFRFIELLAN
jgi:hypothetical protein